MNRNEIEKAFEGVPRELCIMFAVRSALRLLPLLAGGREGKPAFWYWKKEHQSRDLLAVLRAQYRVYQGGTTVADAADAAAAAHAHAHSHTHSHPLAAVAVSAAAAAADAANANAYAGAAYVAAYSAAAARNYAFHETAIVADLSLITSKEISVQAFSTYPLWPDNHPSSEAKAKWKTLQQWMISLDQGFEFWVDWYQAIIDNQPMQLEADVIEKMLNIPAEIEEQGPATINAYLANLANEQASKPLNLVRAIFIGNGAAGKTSVIRRLHNKTVIAGKGEMTPGIEISEWPVADTEIKARLWDFGGQVMSHSTHQFFLRERCLYIVVLEARSESSDFSVNQQAEYWLEHVKAFGKNAKVMLVGNKVDQLQVNLDMGALTEKYPNIVGFYPLSCTDTSDVSQKRFELFKDDMCKQLLALDMHNVFFTPGQFAVLQHVREQSRSDSFLAHDQFNEICAENNITDVGVLNRDWLLDLLDKLGEVIHFPNMARLDEFVLNPRWLTYGVYTLLYSKEVEQGKGELSEAQVVNVLGAKQVVDEQGNVLSYPKKRCGFIIDAMEAFKLCYRLPENRSRFVIPDKLPSAQPEGLPFDKDGKGMLAFEFTFTGFLPRHVMPTLIATRHEEIQDGLVWKNGVLLFNAIHNSTARVQVDYHDRKLSIWVQGDGAKETLSSLREEVLRILNRMGLEYQQLMVLPQHACVDEVFKGLGRKSISYKQLLRHAKDGQRYCYSTSGEKYDLKKVLGEIMSDEQQKKEGVVNNFHGSVGAVGIGNNNHVTGIVNIQNNAPLQESMQILSSELEKLAVMMMEKSSAEMTQKLAAYNELTAIKPLLGKAELTEDESQTLSSKLSDFKSGVMQVKGLMEGFKGGLEAYEFTAGKVASLMALLAPLVG